MSDIANVTSALPAAAPRSGQAVAPDDAARADITKRFEEMLWAEMLSHSGLEKAFTMAGGEAASSFSRFIVEAIAKDIAERHPLGFNPVGDVKAAYDQLSGLQASEE